MSIRLSDAEMAEITGRVRSRAQMNWLKAQLIPFALDADNKPIVLRSVLFERLGGKATHEPKLNFAKTKAR